MENMSIFKSYLIFILVPLVENFFSMDLSWQTSAPESTIAITLNSYSWQRTILTFENHFGGINLLIRLSLLIPIGAVLERGAC